MTLAPGTRVGPYEINSSLGAGGMGEVYRATDTNLKRQVAIKVLPEGLAADADRLARFQREAEVLASLNHQGIAAIYGIERSPSTGTMALVMELVEGPTLAERIARGPIGVAEALPIAKQIAEALEAAHDQGIVHRDLKPANIKLREDGVVKVLDFGLAKALASDARSGAPSASMSPTLSIHATQAGVILGTAAYMSPEQAAGKPVDKRSDLWSFGVVLLEMLTARRVFDGETVSHVLASVLKDAPDLSALPPETPPQIRKLLRRCLEKDRKRRLADAADARLEIEEALSPTADSSSTAPASPRSPGPAASTWTSRAPMLIAFAAGAALAGAAAFVITNARIQTPASSALIYAPFAFEPGGNVRPVWSPDGKGVAFAARQSEDEQFQVYVRYLDSSTSTQLTHLDEEAQPVAWTTAGRIVFRSPRAPAGLWSISQTGGAPEPLLALPGGETVDSATVSPDGRAAAYYGQQDGRFGLWISAPAGSMSKRYTPAPFEADVSVNGPNVRFSPDGKQILLLRNATHGEEAWLMPYPADEGHPPRRVFSDKIGASSGTPRFSWMHNRRVVMSFSAAAEPNRLYVGDTVSGALSLLSSGTTAQLQPAVSPDGTRLAFVDGEWDYNILQVNLASGEISAMLATRRNEDMPAWAMKAAAMAYVTDRSGEPEIWLHEPGRPDRPVVTPRDFPPGTTLSFGSPMLSPDGGRIIYWRVESSGLAPMWLSSLSGGAPVRVTNSTIHGESPGSWSPDGAWFVYWGYLGPDTLVSRVRTTGQATPEVLVRLASAALPGNAVPAWSPAGDWILMDTDGWRLLSPDGKIDRDLGIKAHVCTLSRDGVQLYCVRLEGSGGVLFSRPVAGGPERVIAKLSSSQVPASQLSPALRMTFTPDGRHLTFSAAKRESSLWLLEGIGSQ